MSKLLQTAVAVLMMLTASVPVTVRAARPEPVPAGAPLAEDPAALAYPLPQADLLADEDAWRDERGLPYRFALPEDVSLTPANSGAWDLAADGQARWRLRIGSSDALSLNLGFGRYALPPGARLVLRPADGSGPGMAFDASANRDHGELWTPIVLTDDLLVELTVPVAARGAVELELSRVNRGYRYFGAPEAEKSGPCNIDTVCPAADDWRAEVRSVGVYTVGGWWKCTGAMVNNTASDGRPLFLTANHCDVRAASDHSVVVYWNYESPSCGELGGGSLDDSQTGTTLISRWSGSDFCLLELNDLPDPAWRVTYSGWDRSGAVPDSAVCIHHPSTDEKAISFERDPLTITTYLSAVSPGDESHLRVADWDLGTTEGGSSGSPLYDLNHRIVGQLHGGYAACGNNLADWYGRMFSSWTGGGADSTSLAPHLDPVGSGAVTVDLYDPAASTIAVQPQTGAAFAGPPGGPFVPAAVTWTVSNPGENAVDWSVDTAEDWLLVQPRGGTLTAGDEVTVTAEPAPATAGLPSGSLAGELVFTNEDGGNGGLTVPVSLTVYKLVDGIVRLGPNPFRSFVEIVYSVSATVAVRARIYDMRGREVGRLEGGTVAAGEHTLVWDGTGDDGRHIPGGLYVLELDLGGRKSRASLTLAH